MKPQNLRERLGEESLLNETGLAISYKSKKTAAVIGVGTVGAG